MRRLVPFTLAVLCLAFAATSAGAGGGPSPGVLQSGRGVLSKDGLVRYVALGAGGQTVVASVRVRTGLVTRSRSLSGPYGIPIVAWDGTTGGLSADAKTLVVAGGTGTRTELAVLDARTLAVRTTVTLDGSFSFDALSPNGRLLYLIEHKTPRDPVQYRVRAYDLHADRLFPGAVADKRTRGEAMRGQPLAQVSSGMKGWVYTLYGRGGHAFVHALDTRNRGAVCIALPWGGDDALLPRLRLKLAGPTLELRRRAGGALVATIDTSSFRVAQV